MSFLSFCRDLIKAVRCVNELSEQKLPMKPLKLETGSIFYQLKTDGQYHVLLSDFADKDKSQGARGGNRRRNKGKGTYIYIYTH